MKQLEIINKLNQLEVFGQLTETTEFYLQEPIPKRVGYLLEQFGKIIR